MDGQYPYIFRIRYIYVSLVLILILSSCEKKKEKDVVEYIQNRISFIVNQTSKSVVTVYNKHNENVKFLPDRPFDDESVGSGFVIKKDMRYLYIATNAHVIEKNQTIKVKFYNKKTYRAQVVGLDEKTDIAIIKVPLTNSIKDVPSMKFSDIDSIKIGNFVLAVGNPYGLGITYTFGIVSATDRTVGISQFEDYIQTDAPINPGDSGGPLLDMNGKVIGMNIATVQTGQGLGFAIPVDILEYISSQIIKYGKVERGFIGITVDDISEDARDIFPHVEGGVIVLKVQKDSPAMRSGIKSGDILYKINGELIKDTKMFNRILLKTKPNQMVELEIFRKGEKITINLITENIG